MDLKIISDNQKSEYNQLSTHIVQSFEWGEFRKKLGLKILRYGLFDNGKLLEVFIIFRKITHHAPAIASIVRKQNHHRQACNYLLRHRGRRSPRRLPRRYLYERRSHISDLLQATCRRSEKCHRNVIPVTAAIPPHLPVK